MFIQKNPRLIYSRRRAYPEYMKLDSSALTNVSVVSDVYLFVGQITVSCSVLR